MVVNRRIIETSFAMLLSSGIALAQDRPAVPATGDDTTGSGRLSSRELKEKQIDVSLEARDIERILGKLKKASDLAKSRITEAAVTTETVTADLDKGDSATAQADARQASEMFAEIILQLQALLKEETPQQIAEAKQLANQLAKLEREFAEKYEGMLNPTGSGKGKVDPKSQVRPQQRPNGQGESGSTDPQNQNGSSGTTDPSQPPPGKDDPGSGQDQPAPQSSQTDSNDKVKSTPGAGKSAGTDKKDENDNSSGGNAKKREDGSSQDNPPVPTGGSDSDADDGQNKTGSGGGADQKDDKNGERQGSGMSREELREATARRAQRLAETGKTLQDVLNAIARSTDPADKDATARVQEVLKEIDVDKLVEQMGQVGGMVRAKNDAEAKLSSQDIADRLEIMAQRLDAAYRLIVAPQAEELRKLELELVKLREKLEDLQTEAQIAAWHREARELLDTADKLGISDRARDALFDAMKQVGISVNGRQHSFNWVLINNRYVAPTTYSKPLLDLQEELQARIQSLLLGDLQQDADEATPPKYQELVEQYYKVLSRQGGSPGAVEKSVPSTKPDEKKGKSKL
ncbi:MAG: hypothetical protein JSS49_22265 [Planctomycetes bacterium]|nr:hypothetical protein [Planctomycetota bacterium]